MKTFHKTFRDCRIIPQNAHVFPNGTFYGADAYGLPTADSIYTGAVDSNLHATIRVSNKMLERYLEELSARDFEILKSLKLCRFLITSQIKRLHFYNLSSDAVAIRQASRALKTLRELGLITPIKRRVGGKKKGASPLIWYLTSGGERLLSLKYPGEYKSQRHEEPNILFVRHLLGIAECYTQLIETERSKKDIKLSELEWEPNCWRPYKLDQKDMQLKPDLFVATQSGEYEDRWFIEVDMNTESASVIIKKCERYREYFSKNIEQKKHGVFPIVAWITPTENRKRSIIEAIKNAYPKGGKLFLVITADEFKDVIRGTYSENIDY